MSKYDPESGFGYAVEGFPLFVDFFFILSGFVIGLTYSGSVSTTKGIFTFLRRRIARIYPLYLLTLLAFMTPALLGMSRNPDKWTAASILSDMLLVKNWPVASEFPFNFPAWSISVEWAMYLAFPLIMVLYRWAGMWALAVLIILGFAGLQYTVYAGLTHIPSWFGNIGPIRALPTFCAGIVISQTYDRVKIPYALWWGLFAFLFAVLLMMLHVNNYLAIVVVFIATFLTANAYVSSSKTVLDRPIFLTLGNASYSLYMWHAFFFTAFIDFLWPRISTGRPTLFYGAMVIAILIGFSIGSYRLFERPARNFISGVRK